MGLRRRPYAFTEQGVAMLSSVLHSDRAIDVKIAIMRAFGHLLTRVASARGKTLEQFADEALRRVISENGGVHRTVRNGLPVMVVCDQRATIDPDKIRRWIEEEGL